MPLDIVSTLSSGQAETDARDLHQGNGPAIEKPITPRADRAVPAQEKRALHDQQDHGRILYRTPDQEREYHYHEKDTDAKSDNVSNPWRKISDNRSRHLGNN